MALPGGEQRRQEVEESIRQRVREQAPAWFGTGARPDVRLRILAERPRAVLYGVCIGDLQRPQVLAKVRRDWSSSNGALPAGGRPRLVPHLASAAEQTALEYSGLQEIHRIFGGRDDARDDRFAAVRPLDHVASAGTLLMEYVEDDTLRAQLAGSSRLVPRIHRRSAPGEAWRNAGAWLGVFQRGMQPGPLPARQATRAAVVERLDAYGEFLTRRLGARAVGDVASGAIELAEEVLPEQLTVVVGHGDFAPRNVFAGAGRRVMVFDPMPRWRVPRYEDLARFLVSVRLSGVQVQTHGAAYSTAALEHLEEQVMAGYRSEAELVTSELRCLQVLVLLDRWSALVGGRPSGWRSRLRTLPTELASGHLRREAQRLTALALSPS